MSKRLQKQNRIARLAGLLWMIALLLMGLPGAQAQARHVDLIVVKDAITTPVYNYIQRSIQLAETDGAEALIIQLDTPGGLVLATQEIIQAMSQSRVPIIVYIAPRGAMAASAGTLITLAAHASAMAPGTVIGAAAPVGGQGEDLPETIATKEKEILKAQARTLAARRGEPAVQLAEEMIEKARAVSEQEALQVELIDLIATDLDDLLKQLDGLKVEVRGQQVQLATSGARVVHIAPNVAESVLRAILNPNVSFLLLTIGVQAILIELSSPGGWVAGFIGVVCLALFIYSVHIIPINGLGLVLIGIAFVLFFMETQSPTHGALTLAGLGTFIAGALILYNAVPGPEQATSARLSLPLVIGTGIFTALFFGFIVGKALQAQRRPRATGVESLVGRSGRVQTDLNPRGTVHVFGELWTAEADESPLPAGTKIQVTGVEGLTLRVKRYEE